MGFLSQCQRCASKKLEKVLVKPHSQEKEEQERFFLFPLREPFAELYLCLLCGTFQGTDQDSKELSERLVSEILEQKNDNEKRLLKDQEQLVSRRETLESTISKIEVDLHTSQGLSKEEKSDLKDQLLLCREEEARLYKKIVRRVFPLIRQGF